MTDPFVIIGAGHAGTRAAAELRACGHQGAVLLVNAESAGPYDRPALSKSFLQADDVADPCLHPDGFYAETGIDLVQGAAVSIDSAAHRLTLADGREIAYSKLLLCTGARARRLDIPGADLPDVFYLRSIDDARAIRRKLAGRPRVIVIGGGFIGLEIAATARERQCEVTVLEAGDRLMGRAVPMRISDHFAALHRKRGVDIIFNAHVTAITGKSAVTGVALEGGHSIAADLVVIGIGAAPETDLAERAGLDVDDGILVDAACRTSAPDIFAAGDATRQVHPSCGRAVRLECWQNAQDQAVVAARAMCGSALPERTAPWVWSDQYDANLQLAGFPNGTGTLVFRGEPQLGSFLLFELTGGVISAAFAVNRGGEFRAVRKLIDAGQPVEARLLADEATPLKALAKSLV